VQKTAIIEQKDKELANLKLDHAETLHQTTSLLKEKDDELTKLKQEQTEIFAKKE